MNTIDTAVGYLVGLDLGERSDYTAVTVLRQHAVPTGRLVSPRGARGFGGVATVPRRVPETRHHYDTVFIDRWRGRGYSAIVPALERLTDIIVTGTRQQYREAGLVNRPDLPTWLVVDYTGVGLAVVDDIIRAAGLACVGVTITSGHAVTRHGRDYGVPKRELVSHLQVALQSRRLTMPDEQDFPIVGALVGELDNFRAKINLATGHDSYGAGADWREGNHDDLVLSIALAVWYGENVNPARYRNRRAVAS